MLKNYLKKTGWRRLLLMLIGNIFLGMGVSIFKLSGMGNDAYNAMLMAMAEKIGVDYAPLFSVFSIGLFVIEFAAGRKLIGAGTIVNTFFLGYIVSFFYDIWLRAFQAPSVLWTQILVMLIGVVVVGFGLSMYQLPDVGVSPYDSLSLILADRLPVPYSWCRVFTDAVCALACFLMGGLVGLGTLMAAFGLGPVVQFFNKTVTEKLLAQH